MKKVTLLFMLLLLVNLANAQEDLMDMLDDELEADTKVTATFKSTRLVNGHTIEGTPGKHMDFRINHRFGNLNSGYDGFYGLDNARMRLGFDYGVTDDFMIGIGRETLNKDIDVFGKYRAIRQDKNMPVTVSVVGGAFVTTKRRPDLEARNQKLSTMNRMSYLSQVLVARKFSEILSLQIMPTYVHRNVVATAAESNGIFAMGGAGRIKLTRSLAVTGEYYWQNPNQQTANTNNVIAIGIDIETGGHVFQLHVTNSQQLNEPRAIAETTGETLKGDIGFGFNLVRTFSLAKRK